ncbi:PREDICTED: uncharacterized protein LOC106149486 [Chinchilla lanigera]|uniref:uncharacterized protein LOC106149486 n=1 Tax=Chinchilla lanigera TaxID=34839 RepID=UPI000695ABE0|nr:PREDICTED: uncharacterized protein LOC106149486 [Chinchilla lanigera]
MGSFWGPKQAGVTMAARQIHISYATCVPVSLCPTPSPYGARGEAAKAPPRGPGGRQGQHRGGGDGPAGHGALGLLGRAGPGLGTHLPAQLVLLCSEQQEQRFHRRERSARRREPCYDTVTGEERRACDSMPIFPAEPIFAQVHYLARPQAEVVLCKNEGKGGISQPEAVEGLKEWMRDGRPPVTTVGSLPSSHASGGKRGRAPWSSDGDHTCPVLHSWQAGIRMPTHIPCPATEFLAIIHHLRGTQKEIIKEILPDFSYYGRILCLSTCLESITLLSACDLPPRLSSILKI